MCIATILYFLPYTLASRTDCIFVTAILKETINVVCRSWQIGKPLKNSIAFLSREMKRRGSPGNPAIAWPFSIRSDLVFGVKLVNLNSHLHEYSRDNLEMEY